MKVEFNLQPKQAQFLDTVEKTPITFYGGAKDGQGMNWNVDNDGVPDWNKW